MTDDDQSACCTPEELFWDSFDKTTFFGSGDAYEAYSFWRAWKENSPDASLKACFACILDDKLDLYNDARASDEQIRADLADPSSDPWSEGWYMWTLDRTIIATGLSQLLDEGKIDAEAKPFIRVAIKRQRSPETKRLGPFPTETLDAIARIVEQA